MPKYDYVCDNCDHSFEVQMSIKDFKILKKCPQCKKFKLKQVFHSPHVYVYNDPSTLGLQGKRNWENLGNYEKEKVVREQKEEVHDRKYKPLVEKGMIDPDKVPDPHKEAPQVTIGKKLFKGSQKEQKKKIKKYIEEGKV